METLIIVFFLILSLLITFLALRSPSQCIQSEILFKLMDANLIEVSDPEKSTLVFDLPRSVRQTNTVVVTPGYPTVIDQGPWGACTAFAMRYAYLYWLAKTSKTIVEPSCSFWYAGSRLLVFASNPNYYKTMDDRGSTTSATIQSITNHGTAALSAYPYSASSIFVSPFHPNLNTAVTRFTDLVFTRIPVYARINKIPAWQVQGEAFAAQIDAGKAVLASFKVYTNLQTIKVYKSGVIPLPAGSVLGGHAICLIGYARDTIPSKNVFFFYNSWGTYTGNNGYFTIPWQYIADATKSGDYWSI